jgi:hypothetical protein
LSTQSLSQTKHQFRIAKGKYPTEALQVGNDTLADVQAHYKYLAQHESTVEKLSALKRRTMESRLLWRQDNNGRYHLALAEGDSTTTD